MDKEQALERIASHRERIDELDTEILELLNKRAEESLAIRRLKPSAGLELYDAGREDEIVARLVDLNEGPMDADDIREFYAALLKIMKAIRI